MALHGELGHLAQEELVPGCVVRQHPHQLAVRLRALVPETGPEGGGLQGLQGADPQVLDQVLHFRAAVGTGNLHITVKIIDMS